MAMLIIFWALCGIASCVIASSKGRNGLTWFALGCVLGIFPLIMVAAMPAIRIDAGA